MIFSYKTGEYKRCRKQMGTGIEFSGSASFGNGSSKSLCRILDKTLPFCIMNIVHFQKKARIFYAGYC